MGFLPGEEHLMAQLAAALQVHRPPPVLLGSGRTSLFDKFGAVVHALFLESGCPASLHKMSRQFVSFTTDFGVEFGLPSVCDVEVAAIMPWVASHAPLHGSEQEDGIQDSTVGFSSSLSAPGLMHIVHNASNSLLEVMPHLDEAITMLSDVATFLRTPATAKRLCETCFASAVGRLHHSTIRSFDGTVHRSRWGTIAYCVEELLDVRSVLMWGWNLDAYVQAGNDTTKMARADIEKVNAALTSNFIWAALQTVDACFWDSAQADCVERSLPLPLRRFASEERCASTIVECLLQVPTSWPEIARVGLW